MGKQKVKGWITVGTKELPIRSQETLDAAMRIAEANEKGLITPAMTDMVNEMIAKSIEKRQPAMAYAVRKTGRVVTAENKQYLTQAEIDEWDRYVDEYYENNS